MTAFWGWSFGGGCSSGPGSKKFLVLFFKKELLA
jgi:hypothetical protein